MPNKGKTSKIPCFQTGQFVEVTTTLPFFQNYVLEKPGKSTDDPRVILWHSTRSPF